MALESLDGFRYHIESRESKSLTNPKSNCVEAPGDAIAVKISRFQLPAKVEDLSPWVLAMLFIAGSLAIYFPSLHGEFIWDDVDIYIVENPLLEDPAGLYKFWFSNEPYDYYPLTYSTFWFEWALVGEKPFLYHFNNVILHALTALGVLVLLRQLRLPWPLFLALLFLVHPLQVESVAWICQRKTVLSVFLGVWCCVAYVRDVHSPSPLMRSLSIALLALSLAAKPTLIMLPVVLALLEFLLLKTAIRQIAWKLAPFFAVSLLFGIVGMVYAVKLLGTIEVRDQNWVARLASLSWALLFYVRQLFAFWTMCFVYPRWNIDESSLLAWLPTIVVLSFTAWLWQIRGRLGVAPFAAWVATVLTLLPSLGLVDVFYWRYSYVGDHYLYQSFAPLTVLLALLLQPVYRYQAKRIWTTGALVAVLALSVATYSRCGVYESPRTLWKDSIDRNPNASLALIHLGVLESSPAMIRKAVDVHPTLYEGWYNLAEMSKERGDWLELLNHAQQGIHHSPARTQARLQLLLLQCIAYVNLGRFSDALSLLQSTEEAMTMGELSQPRSIRSQLSMRVLPLCIAIGSEGSNGNTQSGSRLALDRLVSEHPEHRSVIAQVCEDCGLDVVAIDIYEAHLQTEPQDFAALAAVGRCYVERGEFSKAIVKLKQAIELGDESPGTLGNYGVSLVATNERAAGLEFLERAVQQRPKDFGLLLNLGLAYLANQVPQRALVAWLTALSIEPNDINMLRDVAWLIATTELLAEKPELQALALEKAVLACELSGYKRSDCLDSLAAVEASRGDFKQAVEHATLAVQLAEGGTESSEKISELKMRLTLYQQRAGGA